MFTVLCTGALVFVWTVLYHDSVNPFYSGLETDSWAEGVVDINRLIFVQQKQHNAIKSRFKIPMQVTSNIDMSK